MVPGIFSPGNFGNEERNYFSFGCNEFITGIRLDKVVMGQIYYDNFSFPLQFSFH
jgi:hypothetical protein